MIAPRTPQHPRLTCLVPAWNEAARLSGVLEALVGHPLIDRLLVIDDGSTDGTAEIAEAAGAEVLRLGINRGKTCALAAGIDRLEGRFVMLIDADLQGLTAGDVTRLAMPVLTGAAEVSISLRSNAPWIWRAIGVDYISGERVLPVALLKRARPALPGLPRFGFEVFLNRAIRAGALRVAIVDWPGVVSPTKGRKQGFWRGLRGDLAMVGDILRCQSPRELLVQILYLRRGAAFAKPRQNRACSATAAAVSPATSPAQTPTPPSPATKPNP